MTQTSLLATPDFWHYFLGVDEERDEFDAEAESAAWSLPLPDGHALKVDVAFEVWSLNLLLVDRDGNEHELGWWDHAQWHPYVLCLEEWRDLRRYWAESPLPADVDAHKAALLAAPFVGVSTGGSDANELVLAVEALLQEQGVDDAGAWAASAVRSSAEAAWQFNLDHWTFGNDDEALYSLRNREGDFPVDEFERLLLSARFGVMTDSRPPEKAVTLPFQDARWLPSLLRATAVDALRIYARTIDKQDEKLIQREATRALRNAMSCIEVEQERAAMHRVTQDLRSESPPPATDEQLSALRAQYLKLSNGAPLPRLLEDIYKTSNGATLVVGNWEWGLFEVDVFTEMNEAYELNEYMPGGVSIGLNGGGVHYVLDVRNGQPDPPVYASESGNLGWDDAVFVADSLGTALLNKVDVEELLRRDATAVGVVDVDVWARLVSDVDVKEFAQVLKAFDVKTPRSEALQQLKDGRLSLGRMGLPLATARLSKLELSTIHIVREVV